MHASVTESHQRLVTNPTEAFVLQLHHMSLHQCKQHITNASIHWLTGNQLEYTQTHMSIKEFRLDYV